MVEEEHLTWHTWTPMISLKRMMDAAREHRKVCGERTDFVLTGRRVGCCL